MFEILKMEWVEIKFLIHNFNQQGNLSSEFQETCCTKKTILKNFNFESFSTQQKLTN